jgi:hypothetical protein
MKRRKKLSLTQMAMSALTEAVAEVVEDHRRRNIPLAVWRHGKAVWISANDAELLREYPAPHRAKGRDLAEALAKTGLPGEEARAWRRDLQTARKRTKPATRWSGRAGRRAARANHRSEKPPRPAVP